MSSNTQEALSAIGLFTLQITCSIIVGLTIACAISYVYNDYNNLMQFGLPLITWSQMYLGLLAWGTVIVWTTSAQTLKKSSENILTPTDMFKNLFKKLIMLGIVLIMYNIVKWFVFN